MASQYLIDTVRGYENYISQNGIDEQVIDAYIMAVGTAITEEKDVEYGLKVSARAKELIINFVADITAVLNFFQFSKLFLVRLAFYLLWNKLCHKLVQMCIKN